MVKTQILLVPRCSCSVLQSKWSGSAELCEGEHSFFFQTRALKITFYTTQKQTSSPSGGWYGSSVQANGSSIFVCGHRAGYDTYRATSMYMGMCYTIDSSNRERELIKFKSQNSFVSSSSTKFYDNGVYGVREFWHILQQLNFWGSKQDQKSTRSDIPDPWSLMSVGKWPADITWPMSSRHHLANEQ